MWCIKDIAKDPFQTLTLQQKRKLDEAMALVDRTQLPLCCNVCLQCHLLYYGIAYVYMPHAIAMEGWLMMWGS